MIQLKIAVSLYNFSKDKIRKYIELLKHPPLKNLKKLRTLVGKYVKNLGKV